MLAWQTEELLKREVDRDAGRCTCVLRSSSRSRSTICNPSPRYPGKLALRFARVKGYRPDKKAQDADTMDAVRAIYAQQAREALRPNAADEVAPK